jgi:hypothetical protein
MVMRKQSKLMSPEAHLEPQASEAAFAEQHESRSIHQVYRCMLSSLYDGMHCFR